MTAADLSLAVQAAQQAGDLLVELQESNTRQGKRGWWVGEEADRHANQLLIELLSKERPEDGILSEESPDSDRRLGTGQTWIIDPLDGSGGFGAGQGDWAVHIGLVSDGLPVLAAVGVPALNKVFSTGDGPAVDPEREIPIVFVGRSRVYPDGQRLAKALGGTVRACGSAGVKAMLVVSGEADVYVHAAPLYEWDVCAPAAVAEAAGLTVSDPFGDPLVFNRRRPVVPGLVIARPHLHAAVLDSL